MNKPQKNETWILKTEKNDPFPPKKDSIPTVRILETKEGWVRYYSSASFPDERQEIKFFIECWEKA